MALTVPGEDELQVHMRRTSAFSGTTLTWAEDSLQRATDLMQIATGLTEDPELDDDGLAIRVMTTGILAMAHFIYAGSFERSAMYSPFQSERIGSYSYSKLVTAVQTNQPTGVPEFDFAVQYLRGLGLVEGVDPVNSVAAEEVFDQPYSEYAQTTPERDIELTLDAWGH